MKRLLSRQFVPGEENEYKPHALRTAAVVGMTFLVVLTFAIANIQSLVWTTSEWMVSTILPAVIVTDTNEERAARERPPLRRSEVLDRAATMKAQHMANNEYFAHFSPDGVSPWHWFDQAGYDFVHAGENLAVYFTDSSEIVDAWMNSPLHRANILDRDYQEIGIGVAEGEFEGYETVYVVQLFGTPVASAFTNFRSVERTDEPPSDAFVVADAATTSAPQVAGAAEAHGAEPTPSPNVPMLQSAHLATTTGGRPAPVDHANVAESTPPTLLAALTQPRVVLQGLYLAIATFVVIALVFSIVASMRRRRPMQIAYGIGLLMLMGVLFHVHIAVSTGVLIA